MTDVERMLTYDELYGEPVDAAEPPSPMRLAPAERPVEPSSWEPTDLAPYLDGTATDEAPTVLARSDGVHTLYAGKVNAFNGENESMKSWGAQAAAAQVLVASGHVVFVDFEDSPRSVARRMLALGVEAPALLARFHYHRPHEPFGDAEVALFRRLMGQWRPGLVVFDGITEAMSIHGYDLRDNDHVARFMVRLPRRFARTGAAVVLVDHVTKDRETRGRYAIGAQHKLASIDGAAYTFEAVTPFGRGRNGVARLTVAKDRPGYVRQHAHGATFAELHLNSHDGGHVTAELRPPAHGDGFTPTVLMERTSRALEEHPAGLNTRALRAAVSGNNNAKTLALETLLAGGYVRGERVGAATRYTSVRPYRAEDEP